MVNLDDLIRVAESVKEMQSSAVERTDELNRIADEYKELHKQLDRAIEMCRNQLDFLRGALDESKNQILGSFPASDVSLALREGTKTVDGLIRVLTNVNRWLTIKELTEIALGKGVSTKSKNPHRVFSSALSHENTRENPRVAFKEGKWGLPDWSPPSVYDDIPF